MNYVTVSGALQIALGVLTFGALFSAPITPATTLLFGSAVLLVLLYLDRAETHRCVIRDETMDQFGALFAALDDLHSKGVAKPMEHLQALVERTKVENVLNSGHLAHVLVTIGQFLLWVGGGFVLSRLWLADALANLR